MTTPNHQSTDHLATRVLRRISDEHVTPRPRFEFLFKNYFFWALGALAVMVGSLAFSATLFEIENADWRLSVATHADLLSFFLATAPFLWIFVLALFILIGYLNVRRTAHGYRYSLAVIALGAVLTSLTLGSGLYALGLGGEVEEAIGDHPPFYRPILAEKRSWWAAPEKGLLGGQVVEVASDVSSFALLDFNGHSWQVDGSDLAAPDLAVVARGGTVHVVGTSASTTSPVFHACFVFPWKTYGRLKEDTLPPPLAAFATSSGKGMRPPRSDLCKKIRTYEQLRTLDEPDSNP